MVSMRSLLKVQIVMSDCCNGAGKLLQSLGPTTWKALSLKLICKDDSLKGGASD